MSVSLKRREERGIASERRRSYALSGTPQAAMEHFRSSADLHAVSRDEGRSVTGGEPLLVLENEGFTIYKPWGRRIWTPDGVATDEIAIGPAVVGRLTATPRGCELEMRVKKFGPAPSQRRKLRTVALGTSVVGLAMLVATAAHPIALALVGVSLAGILGSVLLYGRRQRNRDIRDLLSIVERTFGPLELPAAEGAPHRRDDQTDEG